jgi:hypothetical protein
MFDSPEARPMFAISLILVVVISAAVLLYQYWSGALAERESEGAISGLRPELRPDRRDEHPTPARAA